MATKTDITKEELRQFCGSENAHGYRFAGRPWILTDGALYVAEQCGAFWLADVVFSYQFGLNFKDENFQVWTLDRAEDCEGWYVVADDGNGTVLAKQHLPFTDFPVHLMPFRFWLVDRTLMLPSEY